VATSNPSPVRSGRGANEQPVAETSSSSQKSAARFARMSGSVDGLPTNRRNVPGRRRNGERVAETAWSVAETSSSSPERRGPSP
jgi:hypothetical protein